MLSVSQPLLLPPDVQVRPLREIPPSVRGKLLSEPDDYLVFREGNRAGHSLVSSDTALLLQAFETPRTIPEALRSISKQWTLEHRDVLQTCLEILIDFVRERVLVPAGGEHAEALEFLLEEGDSFQHYTIVRALRLTMETEVHQVKSEQGGTFVLRLARSRTAAAKEPVLRDLAALRQLGGDICPLLIADGTDEGRAFSISEWIDGIHPNLVADGLRGDGRSRDESGIWALCSEVLSSFAKLHGRGVIHGDVQPGNLLVTRGGQVRLIDFGFSQIMGGAKGGIPPLAGMETFVAPEMVRRLLGKSPPGPLSEASEQYSVAALLFGLCTGEYYLRFNPLRREVFGQILSATPRTFAQSGAPSWPAAEKILRQALAKDPGQRFASVEEMAKRWKEIRPRVRVVPSRPSLKVRRELIEDVRREMDLDSGFHQSLLGEGSTATVFLGAAGIAFGLYRLSCATDEPQLLAAAQVWLRIALDEARRSRGLPAPASSTLPRGVSKVSLYHSRTGIGLVRATLGRAVRDRREQKAGIESFLRASKYASNNLDLTDGSAGLLLGTAALLELGVGAEQGPLLELGTRTADALMEKIGGESPIRETRENLGMAHGWAGLLYATLRWSRAANRSPPEGVLRRLQELKGLAKPGGEGLRWRWTDPGKKQSQFAHMPGWCNGSAGFVHLFSLASEAFEPEGFLETAEGAGWDVWGSRFFSGHHLCCGLAGRAYALLNLHRSTGDPAWLAKAEKLADRAVAHVREGGTTESPNSLYRGRLGLAVLVAELERPEEATMPFFEPEDWAS